MANHVSHNNDRKYYRIAIDTAKEGDQIFNLTEYFKGRVGDRNYGLQMTWYEQGSLKNVKGLKPYIRGNVGHYSIGDDGEIIMAPDAAVVSYVGDPSDTDMAGRVVYHFPEQMFPQEGIFYGFLGLLDDSDGDKRLSGVNVWFKVLGGVAYMGKASAYYIDEMDKLIHNSEERIRQLLDQGQKDVDAKQAALQAIVDDYKAKISDLIDRLNAQGQTTNSMMETVKAGLSALETKIQQDGLFTQAEADAFKQQLLTVINGLQAKWHDIEVIDYKPTRDGKAHTLSESYASVDEAQKDYPTATSLTDTKDWCAITAAIQEGQKQGRNIYLAPGNYFVNKTVKLPTGVTFYGAYQNSKIYASQQMSDDSKKQPLAILEYDDEGQPPIYIENIQVLGSSDQNNQLIGLHLGGNRASKISNFIVSYCFGHGTLVYPTHPQSADVENTTFEHYWQVQSGSFCIKSNASINRGNITDFAVYDSQITTLDVRDENQSNTSAPAVEIINEENKDAVKSVYGIEFTRCFLHAQGNNLVRIVGCHAPRATHSINFDFIKGELHDVHGDLGSGSDPYFIFHLENCSHIMIDHSSQLAYSGASFVELVNSSYCDLRKIGIDHLGLSHPDSMIFTADKYSCENTINLMLMDIYHVMGGIDYKDYPTVGSDFGNAYDAMDLFSHMRDEGIDNHIIGDQIGQTLTLNDEPHRLKEITNGKIDGLMSERQIGVTSSTISGSVHTKHVFAKGVQRARLILPTLYQRTSSYLISLRAIGAPSDIQKLEVLTGSNFFDIPTDQKFHYWTGICPTNVLNGLGIQMKSDTDTLENDVTIEIEYLDCFMENKIPYYPDFVALPAPKVGEANY